MRRLAALLFLFSSMLSAQTLASFSGWCEQGGVKVQVQGQTSSTLVQQSYPNLSQSGTGPSVTVYLPGTTTKATIYSDGASTPKANPFPCSATGQYLFFAANGSYDLLFSGTGISSFTRGSIQGVDPSTVQGVLNVAQCGAKGDGSTDDYAAIAACITRASSTGRCLQFFGGTFPISQKILIGNTTTCLLGSSQTASTRLKYTGAGSAAYVLKIDGDTTGGAGFVEGSTVRNFVIDANGLAVTGLYLHGVVASEMTNIRVTNSTGVGIRCDWCQQTTFNAPTVSNNFEPFTTTPTIGILGDGNSSANILNNANVDGVSTDGLRLLFAGGWVVNGGAFEREGGCGIALGTSGANFSQYSTFISVDLEENGTADYCLGKAQGNSFFPSKSFSTSTLGVSTTADTNNNTFIGGIVGPISLNAATHDMKFQYVEIYNTGIGPDYTDPGYPGTNNTAIGMYNPFTADYNNARWGHQLITTWFNGNNQMRFDAGVTNAGAPALILTGDNLTNYIHINAPAGGAPGIHWQSTNGLKLLSETTPSTGAVIQGGWYNGNWCFGTFTVLSAACAYNFHFWNQQAGQATTFAIQAADTQNTTPIMRILNNAGSIIAQIGATGNGRFTVPGPYANNAAAIGAGLAVGDLYLCPAADPQPLCVVK